MSSDFLLACCSSNPPHGGFSNGNHISGSFMKKMIFFNAIYPHGPILPLFLRAPKPCCQTTSALPRKEAKRRRQRKMKRQRRRDEGQEEGCSMMRRTDCWRAGRKEEQRNQSHTLSRDANLARPPRLPANVTVGYTGNNNCRKITRRSA